MQSHKSNELDTSFIWPTESHELPSAAHQHEFQTRVGFFESHFRAAKLRREEKHRKRLEAKKLRQERLNVEGLEKGWRPCRLVDREDAPEYLKRQFIHTGYLVGGTPAEAAWRTLFSLNNETLNAYTMIPPCVFAFYGVYLAEKHLPGETAAFWILLMSCVPHAPFSIGLHLTDGTTRPWRDLWRALDVFFIFTCGVPRAAALGWYVFYSWQQYLAFMILVFSIYGRSAYKNIICGRIKEISKPALARAVTTTIACYSSPVLLAALQELTSQGAGMICYIAAGISITFVFSALTYGCKYPERLAPGKFDLIGNGHQLMHISATVEYSLELVFVWCMATRKAALKQSIEEEDSVIQGLLGRLL